MLDQMLTVWSDSSALSVAIWLAILVLVLYLGRTHAHLLLRSTGRAIYSAMRLWAHSITQLENRLIARNRDVLLAMGRSAAETSIEREFNRVTNVVDRDLSQYPALHRKIADSIQKIEVDYLAATDSPPLPPAWSQVVETIAALPSNGDPAVNKVLDNIKNAIDDSHKQTLKIYQKSSLERHKLLTTMQPEWRSLGGSLEKVKQTIDGLGERSKTIDAQMRHYESIRASEDHVVNSLTASSITQFFIAGLVMIIAIFGGLINFHLIAMPMSEMVGSSSYVGGMRVSDVAALVIIMIEVAMGLFLLESLRITHLFPVIGSMDDKMRRRMMIVSLTILTILASIEASLAYMRDLLALDREALTQSLAGVSVVEAEFRWIPSLGQMVMGFILPFALAFVAIPMESFIHALRTVLGMVAVSLLRGLRMLIRMVGGLVNHLSKMLVHLYDLVIMLPLGIEQIVRSFQGKPAQPGVANLSSWKSDTGRGSSDSKKSAAK